MSGVNTSSKIAPTRHKGDWVYGGSIQIMATLAALFHDIGKSTNGFQEKLAKGERTSDPYRHEWISLKLFSLIIKDCKTDNEWLNRLVNISDCLLEQDIRQQISRLDPDEPVIGDMPPLAQWLAWLIVTHHRLPPLKEVFLKPSQIKRLKSPSGAIDLRGNLYKFYCQLKPLDYWVKNPNSFLPPKKGGMSQAQLENFWQFNNLVIHSGAWQKHIGQWAKKALSDPILMQVSKQTASSANQEDPTVSNPLLLHLSRLCLMVGDHNYSSLKVNDKRSVKVEESFSQLAANTATLINEQKCAKGQTIIKQSLEEHLIGVGQFTSSFAQALPTISNKMPRLKNHDPLSLSTNIERFKWQNDAYSLSLSCRQASKTHGFFGVNMASTGAGKTIGNARIMYGLSDPKLGARFTIALGLRVLTLQTGLSFKKDLDLKGEDLAILVGGSAHKTLFEMNHNLDAKEAGEIVQQVDTHYHNQAFGSESNEELVDEHVESGVEHRAYEALHMDTVIANPKARDLLLAPIVTCTVDHLIQASECKRGGKYIAPLLRLLSSDLILDEPDDFDQADLPALTRLMYLAGLMGTRVVLSSATLTPDLVTGLFNAYLSGRHVFNDSQNKPEPNVICAWFDEQPKSAITKSCANTNDFISAHDDFANKRTAYLARQPVRRKAQILPLDLPSHNRSSQEDFYKPLARCIVKGAIDLHHKNSFVFPGTGQNLSFGLVRIANVNNIIGVAQQLFNPENTFIPEDTIVHVACYHAKQLLLLRNALESKLDRILERNNEVAPFEHSEVLEALKQDPSKNHIFMVLATPVAEVGRDHDYDWAIVEPSSMRSIIQLSGRVGRHRPDKIATESNILLLQYNIRYFKQKNHNQPVFTRPGFETSDIKTISYDLNDLITKEQLKHIDARPRIKSPGTRSRAPTQAQSLAHLEHMVMKDLMNNNKLNYINAYYHPITASNRLHTHLQQITPFRAGKPQRDWLLIPHFLKNNTQDRAPDYKEKENFDYNLDAYYQEDVLEHGLLHAGTRNKEITSMTFEFKHPQVKPWLYSRVIDALSTLQNKQHNQSLLSLATTYSTVSLERTAIYGSRAWQFHEYFGFSKH